MTASRRFRDPWRRAVASMLLAARESAGLSQDKLGALLGRNGRNIRRIEAGENQPTGDLADRWLTACNWDSEILAGPIGATDSVEVATDAFVMDAIKHARERGIREERDRVCSWLRTFREHATDGPWFAQSIEHGEHDAGRTFPPLPPDGDASGSTNPERVGATTK